MSLYERMASAAILSGQYDDGLTIQYNVPIGMSPNHVQHTAGVVRTGVKLEADSPCIGETVKSVWLSYRKFGNPVTGNVTVTVRKASDDTVGATIGTFPIQTSITENAEKVYVVRNRANTYECVEGDLVSIEFPADATDGLEVSTNSSASDPTGYTSRSYSGTVWSSALSDPLALIIKT